MPASSSMGTNSVDSQVSSIFDNTATISKNVECRGDFILVDPFTNSEQRVTDDDFSKINLITNGQAGPSKAIVLDSNKNISGINNQTNYGQFRLSHNADCACDNFLFKRSRGTANESTKTYDSDKIGSINFLPLMDDAIYYNSSSMHSRVVGKTFTQGTNKYIGSEIIFNTTGIGTDTYHNERLKIDTYGNLSILNRKELRLYSYGINNFTGFRSSSSTTNLGYVMELPPDKGSAGDTLTVQSVGSGGQIQMTSNSEGVITNVSISNAGQGYDLTYPPEINTREGLNGGVRTINGTISSQTNGPSNNAVLSSNESTIDDYYNGWMIKTINPDYERIITDYNGSSKTITLSSSITTTTTSTMYSLIWAPYGGVMTAEKTLDSNASPQDNVYIGWTISVDVDGTIATGVVQSYNSTSKIISVTLSPEVTTTNGTAYSLINKEAVPASIKVSSIGSSGEITGIDKLDSGQGYIPNSTINVNLSSQNKLQWTPSSSIGIDISSWGVIETITGTCNNTTSSGSASISVGSSLTLSDGHNMNYLIVTNNPVYIAHVISYNKSGGTLTIEGTFPSETNTSTTFKLYNYRAGGRTGDGTGIGLNTTTSRELNGTFNGQSGNPSNVNDYYRGWSIMSIGSNGSGSDDWGDLYTGIITAYNGSTGVATVAMTSSNSGGLSSAQTGFVLSDSRPYGTNIIVGEGLSGGGNMALNDININLDLSTHDNINDTSNYVTNNTSDKILLQSSSSSTTKLPTMAQFLSTITGTGLSSSSEGIDVATSQNINNIITDDYFKIRGSNGNTESIYLNIGKDDSNNLHILPNYLNNELSSIIFNTNTNNSSDNASFQFNVGENTNILNINNSRVNIKYGFVTSITIANAGNNYSTPPTITFSQSPLGSSFTATATCSLTNNSISSVNITYSGEGYTSIPTITLTGGGGDSASLIAVTDHINIFGAIGSPLTGLPGYFSRVDAAMISASIEVTNSQTFTMPSTMNIQFSDSIKTSDRLGYESGGNISDTESYSVCIGYQSGRDLSSDTINNTYIGFQSGYLNQTANSGTFIGYIAGKNSTGERNTCIGAWSGCNMGAATNNSLMGYKSGLSLTTGLSNTLIGSESGEYLTTGDYNVFIGQGAGRGTSSDLNTTSNSIAIGYGAGLSNRNDNNIYIGYNSGNLNNMYENIFIGYKAGEQCLSGKNLFIGLEAGKNSPSWYSTYIGLKAGISSTGSSNTFIAFQAGINNTSGSNNVFVGSSSGYTNTIGKKNTFIGHAAGFENIEGENNTFVGYSSGKNCTSSGSTFIGYSAGENNTTGTYNTFLGTESGYQNTIGIGNTFIGGWSGVWNINGNYNTFLGAEAGKVNTESNNTFIGWRVGYTNTTGKQNVFMGTGSGYSNINGQASTFIGYNSGYYATGDRNIFMGRNSGYGSSGVNTGEYNIFIGVDAGYNNTSGSRCTFLGTSSGGSNESGDDNIFIGHNTGRNNIIGNSNIYIGKEAGYSNNSEYSIFIGNLSGKLCTAGKNTFIGHNTGKSTTSGFENTIVGCYSGYSNSTGKKNVFMGFESGYLMATGENNVMVGHKSGYSSTGSNNTLLGKETGTSLTDGITNTMVGADAGKKTTEGNFNCFIGSIAGYENTSGNQNTYIGLSAGRLSTTGSYSTYLGSGAGYWINGDYNICIGMNAGPATTNTDDNYLYIDKSALGSGSLIYGNMSTDNNRAVTINGKLIVPSNSYANYIQGDLKGNIGLPQYSNGTYYDAWVKDLSINGSRITARSAWAGQGGAWNRYASTSFGYESANSSNFHSYCTTYGLKAGYMVSGSYNTLIGTRSGE